MLMVHMLVYAKPQSFFLPYYLHIFIPPEQITSLEDMLVQKTTLCDLFNGFVFSEFYSPVVLFITAYVSFNELAVLKA